ncbi:TIGR01459 family HAD-type hydrolase [Propionivibrio sp.]|uniref:TIGR01459 family HAD-type hydrolase n=1 Tax=Propionivibrio sp. TaxID=2212460 RepID=UPI003BF2C366
MSPTTENISSSRSLASAAAYASTISLSTGTTIKFRKSLSAAVEHYDTFLIDQWGVLHDGRMPYPGTVHCLHRLLGAGKQVILISNSGKRTIPNETRLREIGFPRESYSHLVTSGEIAWQMLARGQGPFSKLAGDQAAQRCLLLTSDDPAEFAEGLPIWLADAEAADFILLAGIDDAKPQKYYEQMMATGLKRGIPLICANPDLMRITAQGLKPGAGALADRYQASGGKVSYIGKPYPEIYRHCLMLAATGAAGRALAIGDSLHHDIEGGRAAGIDTLLVMGGVHADVLPDNADQATLNAAIIGIAGRDGALPDWAIPSFKW